MFSFLKLVRISIKELQISFPIKYKMIGRQSKWKGSNPSENQEMSFETSETNEATENPLTDKLQQPLAFNISIYQTLLCYVSNVFSWEWEFLGFSPEFEVFTARMRSQLQVSGGIWKCRCPFPPPFPQLMSWLWSDWVEAQIVFLVRERESNDRGRAREGTRNGRRWISLRPFATHMVWLASCESLIPFQSMIYKEDMWVEFRIEFNLYVIFLSLFTFIIIIFSFFFKNIIFNWF